MANAYVHSREAAVRVKVKKCEPNIPAEWRKFSVDPQITSLEVLYSLLAKAFDIKSDFSIKYKAFDPAGNEIYLAVLSDWDLDAAFLRIHNLAIQTATEPCLILQIDVKPFTEVKEWDVDAMTSVNNASDMSNTLHASFPSVGPRELMSPLQQSFGVSQKYVQHMQTKLPGLIMNQMEKTFSIVQKAFNLSEETMANLPPRAPLADNEFRMFLDALGQIQRSDELRKVIFFGGIDPSLRRVVWKHILNVYPYGMNGHQRMDYMRKKSMHYYKLRDTWKVAIKQGCVVAELSYVTSMVKKDVLRTDRLHPFYAGSDDNQNIASLFNILTTYALNHPSVSYCQGMSDIASPLLVTMNDEAQAYICFCAIMSRVMGNFMLDGIAMTQKFTHLTEALSFYDPEFWEYLKAQQADDLLFCYRWLLLELKREFPFDDALRMLEVQWSSLKYETSTYKELPLFEKEFVPIVETSGPSTSTSLSGSLGGTPISPSYLLVKSRENPYTKVCALRRQSSSASLSSLSTSLGNSTNMLNSAKLDSTRRLNQSLDDNISRHAARRYGRTTSSSKAHQSLDETKMLMLIESARESDLKCTSNDLPLTNDAEEDFDDDVFDNVTSPSSSKSNEPHHFNFHHTNPFKDDAQLNSKNSVQQNLLKFDRSDAISKVFLNSTSSSITDDENRINDLMAMRTRPSQMPRSIAKLQNQNILTNYQAVSNIIAKQIANAATVSENVRRVSSGGGGHFKELKEKIAATSRKVDETSSINERSQQKLVKNFNEFLNFASINKSRIADKFAPAFNTSQTHENSTSNSPSPTHGIAQVTQLSTLHPLVQLTKSEAATSFDDSETSSVPDTNWSQSTAATAIQHDNNFSNNSLHLELHSPTSSTYTLDRTPPIDAFELKSEDGGKVTPISSCNIPNDPSLTPEDSQDQEYYPMTTAITRELRLEAENLDRQVFGEPISQKKSTPSSDIEYEKLGKDSLDFVEDLKENEIRACPDVSQLLQRRRKRDNQAKGTPEPVLCVNTTINRSLEHDLRCKNIISGIVNDLDTNLNIEAQAPATAPIVLPSLEAYKLNPFIDESILDDEYEANTTAVMHNSSSLPEVIVPFSTEMPNTSPDEVATNAADEIAFSKSPLKSDINGACPTPALTPPILPPPSEFGGGNPFLMFLCLTLLLQHRNTIMKSNMDYNEIAMHFDKMVRKHDVSRVLNQARRMYIDYLKMQNAYRQRVQAAQEAARDYNRNATATSNASSEQLSNALSTQSYAKS